MIHIGAIRKIFRGWRILICAWVDDNSPLKSQFFMLFRGDRMFSADPAPGKPGRLSGTSAVSPFSDGGSLALPTGTDESRASISQRFNFRGSA